MNEVKINDRVKMTVRWKPLTRSRGQRTDKSDDDVRGASYKIEHWEGCGDKKVVLIEELCKLSKQLYIEIEQ